MTDRLVLLSGGIDSTTTLAMARTNVVDDERLGTISFNYGQIHSKELQAAAKISKHYNAHHYEQDIPVRFDTVLTGTGEVPKGTYGDHPGLSPTYVPYRNGTLLSLATIVAVRDGWHEIWFGAHASDWNAWAYPDCSPEFMSHQEHAIWIGTDQTVRLITPIIKVPKSEVVKQGVELNAPIELTWSCYRGGERQCGTCPTCHERKAAFKANDLVDPVSYAE